MKRFTLTGQMTALFALCLMVAMSINFVTLVRSRQNSGLDVAIAPAAQKLANALYEQSATGQPAVPAGRHTPSDVSRHVPKVNETARLQRAEARIGQILAANRLKPVEVRAFHTDAGWRANGILHLSAKLDDGRWITVRSPGPAPIGPTMERLLLQMIVLYTLIIIPALFIIRRSARALERLTVATLAPVDAPPVEVEGPNDIRKLTQSFNAMRSRIAGMIEERNVMLGAIGHDLRTPLTALRLEAESIADERARDALIRQIESLSNQFEQILLLAREGRMSGDADTVRLSTLVSKIAGLFPGQPVSVSSEGDPRIVGNRAALSRLISNLVDNALRYGGKADVRVCSDDKHAIVTVRDSGPGIPPDKFDEALKPFARLEPSRNAERGGHGLGLAIAAMVARSHHGAIELANAEPSGLEVTVRLPLAPQRQHIKLVA